jgi:hypothetical protein
MTVFGHPARWLIVKRNNVWMICPPCRKGGKRGGTFHTGAQALAAYAAGIAPAAMNEPWHGKAAAAQ